MEDEGPLKLRLPVAPPNEGRRVTFGVPDSGMDWSAEPLLKAETRASPAKDVVALLVGGGCGGREDMSSEAV